MYTLCGPVVSPDYRGGLNSEVAVLVHYKSSRDFCISAAYMYELGYNGIKLQFPLAVL